MPAEMLAKACFGSCDSRGFSMQPGSRKVKGGKMIVKKAVPGEWGIGSTADAMLQITKLPLLVVQLDAVRSLGRANLRTQSVPDEVVRLCAVCPVYWKWMLMIEQLPSLPCIENLPGH